MKRIGLIFLAAVMLLALVGCGAKAELVTAEMLADKTYVYEKEGFGGDFTICLNGDGTASYYEGPLSSFIGLGTWDLEEDVVCLTVGSQNFCFRAEADRLVYISDGSSNFGAVTVADGERFFVQE